MMANVMYRVSDMLRANGTQCGCMYYFVHRDNAIKAATGFQSSVVPVPYSINTTKSDCWYY